MLLAQRVTTTGDAGVGIAILIVYAIVGIISLVCFIINILNVIDFTKHSDQAWAAAGQDKTQALIVIIVGFVCCNLVALYYWFSIKPKLAAVEQGGGYS
jgi:hypothetical protein